MSDKNKQANATATAAETEASQEIAVAQQNQNQLQQQQPANLQGGSGSLENALDFQRALQAVSAGFDSLDKVEDILSRDLMFNIIDGYLVRDYVDQTDGSISDKIVFKLEMQESGEIKQVMQSDSGVRRQILALFERGRLEGMKVELRNYKFKLKPTGKPSPAKIFDDSKRQIFVNGRQVMI